MVTDGKAQLRPEWPLIMFNDSYVRKPYSKRRFYIVAEESLHKGNFKDGLEVIDVNCLKFPVVDVIDLGRSFWFDDLLARARLHRISYIYGIPQQMSFEDSRKEICDLIVDKRWYGQGDESREQFIERCYSYTNMKDFLERISFYGK